MYHHGLSPSVSSETVKKTLKQYSKLLRRDFLAILVKMTAKQLDIRTVRGDWRTRKGMIAFLQSTWKNFTNLISTDTIFNWYTRNFENAEKFFTNRKFMMFLFDNWKIYSEFFKDPATLAFIKFYQNNIEIIIKSGNIMVPEWSFNAIGVSLLNIIGCFNAEKAENFKQPIQILQNAAAPLISDKKKDEVRIIEEKFISGDGKSVKNESSEVSSPEPTKVIPNLFPVEIYTTNQKDTSDFFNVSNNDLIFESDDYLF